MNFSNLLKNYRERNKMTATELASRLNLSLGYIINIENNHRIPPPIQRCEEIADVLNLTPVERSLFINAAMEERLDSDELLWLERNKARISGIVEKSPQAKAITPEILDALNDHLAVKALMTIHGIPKDVKATIERMLEILVHMKPEKRKAFLELINGDK